MESVPVGQPSLAPVPMCITWGEWRVPVTLGISPWVRRSSLVTMANGTATLHLVFVSHVFTFRVTQMTLAIGLCPLLCGSSCIVR